MVSSPCLSTYSKLCVFIILVAVSAFLLTHFNPGLCFSLRSYFYIVARSVRVCTVCGIQVTTVDEGYLIRYESDNDTEFTLPCQYTLDTGESEQYVQVVWLKDGELVYSIDKTAGVLSNSTYGDEYTAETILGPDLGTSLKADLVLLNPSRDDQGTWTCKVYSLAGGISGFDEMEFKHYIYHGPEFIFIGDNPTSGDINFDRTFGLVELTCHAESFPPVQLTWKRVDEKETLPGSTFYYRDENYGKPDVEKILEANFGNTSNKYKGEYECQAVADQSTIDGVPEDLVGKLPEGPNVRHIITISMYDKPEVKADIEGGSAFVTASVGANEIPLKCKVLETPSPPIKRVTWEYVADPSRTLEKDERENKYEYDTQPQEYSILYIRDIKESDFGEYSCTFENDVGSASVTMTLEDFATSKVVKPPSAVAVMRGETATLTCEVDHPINNTFLSWTQLTTPDTGGYTTPFGVIINVTSAEGDFIYAHANEFFHERYNIVYDEIKNYDLVIKDTEIVDDVEYMCFYGALADIVDPGARLTVVVKATDNSIYNADTNEEYNNKSTVNVREGDSFGLTCLARAGRPATLFLWFRNTGNGDELIECSASECANNNLNPDGTYDSFSTYRFNLTTSDNGAILTCSGIQIDSTPLIQQIVLEVMLSNSKGAVLVQACVTIVLIIMVNFMI